MDTLEPMSMFDKMCVWGLVQMPCVFTPLSPLPCSIADSALQYGLECDMLPNDKYILNVLMAMRPHITKALGNVADVIAPPVPIVLTSAEMIEYELVLLSAHLELLIRLKYQKAITVFDLLTDTLKCGIIFRGDQIRYWKVIIESMHKVLQAHISLHNEYLEAAQRFEAAQRLEAAQRWDRPPEKRHRED